TSARRTSSCSSECSPTRSSPGRSEPRTSTSRLRTRSRLVLEPVALHPQLPPVVLADPLTQVVGHVTELTHHAELPLQHAVRGLIAELAGVVGFDPLTLDIREDRDVRRPEVAREARSLRIRNSRIHLDVARPRRRLREQVVPPRLAHVRPAQIDGAGEE